MIVFLIAPTQLMSANVRTARARGPAPYDVPLTSDVYLPIYVATEIRTAPTEAMRLDVVR